MNFNFASHFAVCIAFALIFFQWWLLFYADLWTSIIIYEEEILEIFFEYSDKMLGSSVV